MSDHTALMVFYHYGLKTGSLTLFFAIYEVRSATFIHILIHVYKFVYSKGRLE